MTSSTSHPLLLCYDGSAAARHAIEYAAGMCRDGIAVVLTVWQPAAGLGSLAWAGAFEPMVNYVEMDRAAAENAGKIAEAGVAVARHAGLQATPLTVETSGPIWKAIADTADAHQATMIVMGSRGHTTLGSILLGSVSNAVVHHASQPTLVVHPDHLDPAELATGAAA